LFSKKEDADGETSSGQNDFQALLASLKNGRKTAKLDKLSALLSIIP